METDLSGELDLDVSTNTIIITPFTNGIEKFDFHIVATVNDGEF
jgi:hypothetical protein